MVGQGSQYAWTCRDANGEPLDGGRSYRLNLPPNIPVKDFWSVILYSNQTRSMIQTDQRFPSVSSQTEGLTTNPDGSVDVYFGPTPPEGKEKNWVQTVPGSGWNTILRLYGPLESWFDKTWRPGEIEPQAEHGECREGASGTGNVGRQSKRPRPDLEANRLPSPDAGPMNITIRCYRPEAAMLDGSYSIPPASRQGRLKTLTRRVLCRAAGPGTKERPLADPATAFPLPRAHRSSGSAGNAFRSAAAPPTTWPRPKRVRTAGGCARK
jgi:hypothetical protein